MRLPDRIIIIVDEIENVFSFILLYLYMYKVTGMKHIWYELRL